MEPEPEARLADETNTEKILSRMVNGAIAGICVGVTLCFAALLPWLLIGSLYLDPSPNDLESRIAYALASIPFALLVGCFIGTIAGVAARTPIRDLPLLTSIGIVGACMAIARFVTIAVLPFQKFGYPYWPAMLALSTGGIAVLLWE